MIRSKECSVKDIEQQLDLELRYDLECTVISIVPIKFKMTNGFGPPGMIATDVKIIWNSK